MPRTACTCSINSNLQHIYKCILENEHGPCSSIMRAMYACHLLKTVHDLAMPPQDRVAALEQGLMKATEDKNAAIAQAERTSRKAGLADRLVNGLSGENKRWSDTIAQMSITDTRLVSSAVVCHAKSGLVFVDF